MLLKIGLGDDGRGGLEFIRGESDRIRAELTFGVGFNGDGLLTREGQAGGLAVSGLLDESLPTVEAIMGKDKSSSALGLAR